MAGPADTADGELSGSPSKPVGAEEDSSTGDGEVATETAEAPAAGEGEIATTASESTDEANGSGDSEFAEDGEAVATSKGPRSGVRLALAFGIAAMLTLGALAGWLGYHAYQGHEAAKQRELFLQVARQGAVNLTTVSYMEAEADVQRILDSSTGTLYDDFLKRSQPFIEVLKQAQSTSAGTVTSAGLESVNGDEAQVLVTVQVKSSNAGAGEQAPRAWRMRMSVRKIGDSAKVSNVAFIP
ncbi:Mce protein [Mycobacterium sp. SMC-2]|uniref:Mce protein n=1 Tax=Mycobacterium sp. SMC-2 TaxID=2857058 RepID=UPI0021B42555|nr:Mce protein [Mycobacterium sp. SMC-2]UXA05337.1 Mce protein [Mycobacterium sp. SMC-2]